MADWFTTNSILRKKSLKPIEAVAGILATITYGAVAVVLRIAG
jgi:hypothetical protein